MLLMREEKMEIRREKLECHDDVFLILVSTS